MTGSKNVHKMGKKCGQKEAGTNYLKNFLRSKEAEDEYRGKMSNLKTIRMIAQINLI